MTQGRHVQLLNNAIRDFTTMERITARVAPKIVRSVNKLQGSALNVMLEQFLTSKLTNAQLSAPTMLGMLKVLQLV